MVGDEFEDVGGRPRSRRVGEHGGREFAVGVFGEAASVGEEFADRDTVGDRQLGGVVDDEVIEADRPVVDELQQHHRDERLRQAPDSKRRARFNDAAIGSGAPGRRHGELLVVAGECHCDAATPFACPSVEQTLHPVVRDGIGCGLELVVEVALVVEVGDGAVVDGGRSVATRDRS